MRSSGLAFCMTFGRLGAFVTRTIEFCFRYRAGANISFGDFRCKPKCISISISDDKAMVQVKVKCLQGVGMLMNCKYCYSSEPVVQTCVTATQLAESNSIMSACSSLRYQGGPLNLCRSFRLSRSWLCTFTTRASPSLWWTSFQDQ